MPRKFEADPTRPRFARPPSPVGGGMEQAERNQVQDRALPRRGRVAAEAERSEAKAAGWGLTGKAARRRRMRRPAVVDAPECTCKNWSPTNDSRTGRCSQNSKPHGAAWPAGRA